MTTITLPERDLEILSGTLEENFKYLAERLRVRVAARGDTVSLEGEPEAVAAAAKLVAELGKLVASGYSVGKEEFRTAIRVAREDPSASLVEFFTDSPFGPTLKSVVTVRNIKQRIYAQTITGIDLVFAIGPAGTGKTYLAVAMAAAALLEKKVKRIVLARPAVEAGERLGFLPGDLVEKVNPYLRPLYDALYDILGYEKTAKLLERGVIEVAPIAFMRGRTLNDSFMLLDEAQNTTSEQMKMFLTRTRVRLEGGVTGTSRRSTCPTGETPAWCRHARSSANLPGICFFDFAKDDVVRHRLVEKVVAAYEAWRAEAERRDRAQSGKDAKEARTTSRRGSPCGEGEFVQLRRRLLGQDVGVVRAASSSSGRPRPSPVARPGSRCSRRGNGAVRRGRGPRRRAPGCRIHRGEAAARRRGAAGLRLRPRLAGALADKLDEVFQEGRTQPGGDDVDLAQRLGEVGSLVIAARGVRCSRLRTSRRSSWTCFARGRARAVPAEGW